MAPGCNKKTTAVCTGYSQFTVHAMCTTTYVCHVHEYTWCYCCHAVAPGLSEVRGDCPHQLPRGRYSCMRGGLAIEKLPAVTFRGNEKLRRGEGRPPVRVENQKLPVPWCLVSLDSTQRTKEAQQAIYLSTCQTIRYSVTCHMLL